MTHKRNVRRSAVNIGAGLLPALAGLAFTSTPAAAEDTAAAPEEVVVTGSRIRGVEVVGSTTLSLGRDLIDSVPAVSTADLMRTVPQVINLGADESHRGVQGGQTNTNFTSGVNLRGIGGNTTLLLFDGRRMTPQGSRGVYFDPSLIPAIVIERIEVVPDGASAIYGSDAIAGVVNLIPRKEFNGAEIRAQYGVGDDYSKYNYSAIGGLGWDWLGGGNFLMAVERAGHPDLSGADRDFFTSDLRSRGGGDYRTNLCNPGTMRVGGQDYAIPAGQDGTNLDPSTLVPGTVNLCDDAKNTYLLPDQQRHTVYAAMSQHVSDSVELFTQGYYTDRQFSVHGMLRNSVARAALTVPSSNAYFVSPVPGATSAVVNYRFPEEFGLSIQDGYDRGYQTFAGANVRLPGDWNFSTALGYGETRNLFRDNNLLNNAALAQALASSDPATALNPFADGPGSTPQSVFDSIRAYSTYHGRNVRRTANIDVDGPLFALPGGEVRIAAGYDRVEDRVTGRNRSTAGVLTDLDLSREVDSVYAELFVPVFGRANAVRGIERLDLSIAARHDDYSDVGTTTNPKYGVTWSPVDGLTLRASYGESFRAPTLRDLVPEGQIHQRQLPDPSSPTGMSTGLLFSGGNANLDPETAETRSWGLEIEPDALPGAKLSVNFFDIEYRGQVVSLYGLANALLQNPYYARYIQRDPTPQEIDAFLQTGTPNGAINPAVVTFLGHTQAQNLSITSAAGFDIELGYMWSTNVGDLAASIFGTRFTDFETVQAVGAEPVDVLNTIDFPPKTRMRADVRWRLGEWRASSRINYLGSYVNNLVTPFQDVDDYLTLDLHVEYAFDRIGAVYDGLTIALDIENVFDEDPPFVDQIGGFDPQAASAIGRMFSLSLRKRW